LCAQFVLHPKAAACESAQQIGYGTGVGSKRGQQRLAANQDKMAAHIERGIRKGERNRIFKRIAVRHQGSGREDSVPVRFNDAPIHVMRKAKIVGVDG
jgi:hypothetical protein